MDGAWRGWLGLGLAALLAVGVGLLAMSGAPLDPVPPAADPASASSPSGGASAGRGGGPRTPAPGPQAQSSGAAPVPGDRAPRPARPVPIGTVSEQLDAVYALSREFDAVDERVQLSNTPTAAEEDAEIARSIADRAKVLDQMRQQIEALRNAGNDAETAQGLLTLADTHEQMADFLADRPAPSYMQGDDQDRWDQAIETRAQDQRNKAAEARIEAEGLGGG